MDQISVPQEQQVKIQDSAVKDFPLASVFERAIAFLIDFMLWLFVSSFLYGLLDISFNSTNSYFIICIFVFVLYETVFTAGKFQTIGKFLLGIKVIDRRTKQNLNLWQSFLRAIGYLISILTLCLGFAFVLFSKKRLALQDLIAKSEVVTIREKSGTEMMLISFVGTFLISLSVYFVYNNFIYDPYKAMKSSAYKQLAKVAYLEELHKQNYGVYTSDLLRLALISGDAVQFQRDMQQYFRPSGFQIGITEDGYYIEGFAKDSADPAKSTLIHFVK